MSLIIRVLSVEESQAAPPPLPDQMLHMISVSHHPTSCTISLLMYDCLTL
jgi:hypothetical protein